ncbi:MAG: hypothetical protein EPO20_22665 [Betaproteobacteria bacterium]|nr:MAG: hypothetical protein EPO20_22665 [Betaproteobacteria bacterium]
MARKPIHLQAAGKLTPRDRIWAAVRAHLRFTFASVADCVVEHAPAEAQVRRIDEDTIKTYVESLVRAGFVRRLNPTRKARYEPALFELVRDVGVHAPRLTKAGEPVTQGAGRLAMWRVMRKLRRFTRAELAAKASTEAHQVAVEDARSYVHHLVKAGYIAVVTPGRPNHPEVYSFVPSRNTGPLAPQIQRVRHVYDPNLGKVVWHPEADA